MLKSGWQIGQKSTSVHLLLAALLYKMRRSLTDENGRHWAVWPAQIIQRLPENTSHSVSRREVQNAQKKVNINLDKKKPFLILLFRLCNGCESRQPVQNCEGTRGGKGGRGARWAMHASANTASNNNVYITHVAHMPSTHRQTFSHHYTLLVRGHDRHAQLKYKWADILQHQYRTAENHISSSS